MFSIPSFYELGNNYSPDSYGILEGLLSSTQTDIDIPELSPSSMAEGKAIAASKSHKEAERRRRKRINGHIATLKAILPNTIKTDKATLLGEAVRRVRELKQTASQLSATIDHDEEDHVTTASNSTTSKFLFPSETDEFKVGRDEHDPPGVIHVTLCCDDRAELIYDIIQALKSAEAKVVKAEMSTIGGRTKSVLLVRLADGGGENDMGLGPLKKALKLVLDKSTLLAGSGQVLPGLKRPRYYHF